MKAPKPKNEVQRIKILWQYDVLDTLPEAVFDDFTKLAALICDAPISLISLVDEDRQWFKSKVGVSLNETNRDVSMCAHAILQKDILIVPDATKDKRFYDNPLVIAAPKIRFYAGAPLISPEGQALGTLCVIDKKPRQLTSVQQEALRVLARLVMTQLNFRRQSRDAGPSRAEHEQLKHELESLRAQQSRPRSWPARRKPATRRRSAK